MGVVCADEATASAASWRRFWGSPFSTSPRSEGEKDTVEQKPSDEVTNKVVPSEDLGGRVRDMAHMGKQLIVELFNLPRKIGESGTMQVADNADGCLLLGIIDKDRILCGHRIHHTVR